MREVPLYLLPLASDPKEALASQEPIEKVLDPKLLLCCLHSCFQSGRCNHLLPFLSHRTYLLISFGKSTAHKFVNSLFAITNKDIKLTVLWEN